MYGMNVSEVSTCPPARLLTVGYCQSPSDKLLYCETLTRAAVHAEDCPLCHNSHEMM